MKVLLTHTPQARSQYYGERSLKGLQALAQVVLHEANDALDAAGHPILTGLTPERLPGDTTHPDPRIVAPFNSSSASGDLTGPVVPREIRS